MEPATYPVWVKTIEAIRLANLSRLAEEFTRGGLTTDRAVAQALGISAAYLSQMRKGVRAAIGSAAARKIERKAGKPEGWMDTDFDLWPFPDAALLGVIETLDRDQRVEIQGVIRKHLADLATLGDASGKSSASHGGATRNNQAG